MHDNLTPTNFDDITNKEIIFPFSIEIDPMEKLLLVNFQKDPDEIYVGFEPQVFDDTINGTGHLIIGWRKDKKVDVYHQKSLQLSASKYNIAGDGLNKMIPIDMDKVYFEVTELGVQAHYKFKDINGREVEIEIRENNSAIRKPFGILAPMGDATTNPQSLPMVLLHDFYFVRKNHTRTKVSINNNAHNLDQLPIRIDWQKMTFVRYSPKPLISILNPAFNGILKGINLKNGQKILKISDKIYEIEWMDQKASIVSMSIENKIHPLTIRFTPSFPSLNTIDENVHLIGQFTIFGHPSVGSISGEYLITSKKESAHIKIVPIKGWKPKTTKFSTWFLFSVAKIFKKWPTTYQWDAALEKDADGSWHLQSKWIRTGKISKE